MKTVKISNELHKKLKIQAAQNDLTVTDLVEDAVSIYFDPVLSEKELKEAIENASGKNKVNIAEELLKIKPANLKDMQGNLNKPRGEIHGEDYV